MEEINPRFREEVRLIFLENWRNYSGFLKDFFFRLLFGGNESTFQRKSEADFYFYFFLRIWGISPSFERTFLGCCLEERSPRFREEVRRIFLENWMN